jgi:hypothetical protein
VAHSADPLLAHALSAAIALAGLIGFCLLLRRLAVPRAAGAAALALLATHTALLELRVWASASNGLLALALACWALFAWSAQRTALAALLLLLAMGARIDAVLALLLGLGLLPQLRLARLLPALAAGVLALVLSLRLAGAGVSFEPGAAGQALRLLVFPWGPPLSDVWAGVATLGVPVLLVATARAMSHSRLEAAAWLVIASVAAACALLPWNVAGRYLSFGVLALALLLALHPPRRAWQRAAFALWIGAHLASDVAGNTLRDLRARAAAETALYRAASALPPQCDATVALLDAPPMGWTDSAADAENVLSAAWHCQARARMARNDAPLAGDELGLRFLHGAWLSEGSTED